MKRPVSLAIALVVALFLFPSLLLCAEDKEVDSILDVRAKAIEKANEDAVKKLEKVMTSRTKKGDLDAAIRIKALIGEIKGKGEGDGAQVEGDPFGKEGGGAGARKQIEKSYLEFTGCLIENDLDAAYEYLDPRARQAVAPDALKGVLGMMAGMMRIAQLRKNDVKVKDVVVGMKGNEAKVTPAFRIGLNWEDQKDSYWVERGGKWYLGDEKELASFK